MVKAYIPNNKYSKKNETVITKLDFFSGLITFGQRTIKTQDRLAAGVFTIYQVPAGKTLFLVATNLNVACDGVAWDGAVVYIQSASLNPIIQLDITGADNQTCLSIPFSVPLKVNAGEIISLSHSNAGHATGTIIGYEVDNSSIPNFI